MCLFLKLEKGSNIRYLAMGLALPYLAIRMILNIIFGCK